MQLQELNNHFKKANTELLLCVVCVNPSNSFSTYNKQKLTHLAQFYLVELSTTDLIVLDNLLKS